MTKHAWFMPRDEDVLGLLRGQAATVAEVVAALDAWADGGRDIEEAVAATRSLVDAARTQLAAVVDAIQDSFSTPIEPEDAYELAERFGEVAHRAYALLREVQLSHLPPTPALAGMCGCAQASTSAACRAVSALPGSAAAAIADEAAKALQPADHHVRAGVRQLDEQDDLRYEIRMRDAMRRAEALVEACAHVAHRVRYAVTKET